MVIAHFFAGGERFTINTLDRDELELMTTAQYRFTKTEPSTEEMRLFVLTWVCKMVRTHPAGERVPFETVKTWPKHIIHAVHKTYVDFIEGKVPWHSKEN